MIYHYPHEHRPNFRHILALQFFGFLKQKQADKNREWNLCKYTPNQVKQSC